MTSLEVSYNLEPGDGVPLSHWPIHNKSPFGYSQPIGPGAVSDLGVMDYD